MTAPPRIADRLAPFGTTIFTEMSRLAAEHKAVNLSQGFPDFDGPSFVCDAAIEAMRQGRNQYARMLGEPVLNRAIADSWRRDTGQEIDPDGHVTVTSGCTEAIAATFLGLLNPGEEIILFEPYYDSYRTCAAMAGAVPRFVTLRAPSDGWRTGPIGGGRAPAWRGGITESPFAFDPDELRAAFTPRTRAILVNTPHNPTGKVFSREELSLIADLCTRHDVLAITDEVYERLVYEPADHPHINLAALPGMAERTVTLSSLGKTFSLTGWKIGWAIAPPALTAGVRAAHQFLTFATATPLQHAAAIALSQGGAYIASLVADYHRRRAFLGEALARIGFRVFWPRGSYFILADHSAFNLGDDRAFCRALIERIGVAAIPPSVFYERKEHGRSLARFAFCKREETLAEGVRRLERLTTTG